MGQYFGYDKLTKLIKLGNTQVSLPSGSYIRVGGQARALNTTLTVTTSTSGAGGIDTGSVAASTFYYVYAVLNSTVVALVASTSASAPTGFSSYRKVGAFYTDGSSNIFRAYHFGEMNRQVFSAKVSSAGVVSDENENFIEGNVVVGGLTYTATFVTGVFSVAPNLSGNRIDGGGAYPMIFGSTSVTQAVWNFTGNSGGDGNGANSPCSIHCSRQGIDAIQPDWSV